MKKTLITLAAGCLALGLFGGCDRNPVNKIVNPTLNETTGTWGPSWTLYDDELKTGGTIMSYTSDEGQTLDFASTDHPHWGQKCIKFSWDGSEVAQYPSGTRETSFVGFALIVANDVSKFETTAKNLSATNGPGYTRLTFWARGTLNGNVQLQVKGPSMASTSEAFINSIPSWTGTVTEQWQQYSFPIDAISLASVNDYAKITLKYTPSLAASRGNGGTVFLDDLQLSQ